MNIMKVKSLVVFAILLSLVLYACSPTAIEPANNQIWYQTTSGKPVEFEERTLVMNDVISNKKCGDWCVVEFDRPVEAVPFAFFQGCGDKKRSDGKEVTAITNVWLPCDVKYINESAFSDCNRLKGVIMPDGLEYILPGAFAGCGALDSIVLPNHLMSLGEEAGGASVGVFEGCSNLRFVELPKSLHSLGSNTFRNCLSLKTFIIPEKVWYGEGLFEGCRNLVEVKLPYDSVITDRMFFGCESLSSIDLPYTIKYIGRDAFSGCKKLNALNITDQIQVIGPGAFDDTDLSFNSGKVDEGILDGVFRYSIPGVSYRIGVYLMGYSLKDNYTFEEPKEGEFVYDELLLLMPLNNRGQYVYSRGRAVVIRAFRDINVQRFTEDATWHTRKVFDYSVIGKTLLLTKGLDVDAKIKKGEYRSVPWWFDDEEIDYRHDKRTIPVSCTMTVAKNGQFLVGAPGGLLSKVRLQIDSTFAKPDPQGKYILLSYFNPADRIGAELCGRLSDIVNSDPNKSASYLFSNYESPEDRISRAIQHEIENPSMETQIRFEIQQKQMREGMAYDRWYDAVILRR